MDASKIAQITDGQALRNLMANARRLDRDDIYWAEGLSILWEHQRLDLSVEALVCEEPWRTLFMEDEIAKAEKRLKDLGYKD